MKSFPAQHGWLLRLERGEELHASVRRWARENNVRGATLTGLGAVEDADLAYFHREGKVYERRLVAEVTELLSLQGNLAWRDGEPMLHAHVVLMDRAFQVRGGHLVSAVTAVTVELGVYHPDLRLSRVMDSGIGLPLLECDAHQDS